MSDISLNISNNKFTENFLIDNQYDNQLILHTENTFIDKDIELTFNVQSGTVSTSIVGGTAAASITTANHIVVSDTDLDSNNILLVTQSTRDSMYAVTAAEEGYVQSVTTTQTLAGTTVDKPYYVRGVELTSATTAATATFFLTFPNGDDDTMTFFFEIDDAGNVTIGDGEEEEEENEGT